MTSIRCDDWSKSSMTFSEKLWSPWNDKLTTLQNSSENFRRKQIWEIKYSSSRHSQWDFTSHLRRRLTLQDPRRIALNVTEDDHPQYLTELNFDPRNVFWGDDLSFRIDFSSTKLTLQNVKSSDITSTSPRSVVHERCWIRPTEDHILFFFFPNFSSHQSDHRLPALNNLEAQQFERKSRDVSLNHAFQFCFDFFFQPSGIPRITHVDEQSCESSDIFESRNWCQLSSQR